MKKYPIFLWDGLLASPIDLGDQEIHPTTWIIYFLEIPNSFSQYHESGSASIHGQGRHTAPNLATHP